MALLLAALLLPGRGLQAPGVEGSGERWGGRRQMPGQRRLEGSSGAGARRWEESPSGEKPGEPPAWGKGRGSGA